MHDLEPRHRDRHTPPAMGTSLRNDRSKNFDQAPFRSIDKFHSNTQNGNPVNSHFHPISHLPIVSPSFRKRCFDVRIWFAPIATSRLDLSTGANLYRFRPTSRLPRKVHTGTGYVWRETREQSRPYALLRASAVSPWLTT